MMKYKQLQYWFIFPYVKTCLDSLTELIHSSADWQEIMHWLTGSDALTINNFMQIIIICNTKNCKAGIKIKLELMFRRHCNTGSARLLAWLCRHRPSCERMIVNLLYMCHFVIVVVKGLAKGQACAALPRFCLCASNFTMSSTPCPTLCRGRKCTVPGDGTKRSHNKQAGHWGQTCVSAPLMDLTAPLPPAGIFLMCIGPNIYLYQGHK